MKSVGFRALASGLFLAAMAQGACTQERSESSASAPEKAAVDPSSHADEGRQPVFAMKAEAVKSPQTGWQSDAPTRPAIKKGESPKDELPPLTAAEQVRYDRVARTLVTALNAHDKTTYRKLFTDDAWENAIDWYRDMFAVQLMRFGKIERAYSPSRGIVRVGKMGIGGDARNGASFVAIFEDQVGGVFSIELNDKDQIVHSSIFIKQEIAAFDGWDAKPIYELPD